MENAALWRECAAIQGELVEMRRALHRIPETGERLEKTSGAGFIYRREWINLSNT